MWLFLKKILPTRPASWSHPSTFDIESVFSGYQLMKLPVDLWGPWFSNERLWSDLVLMLSCAPGPPTPFSILVRRSLCCPLKRVFLYEIFSFLGNFSHGIAFISQNRNRLITEFFFTFLCPFWECNKPPKNAEASDTKLAWGRPIILFL